VHSPAQNPKKLETKNADHRRTSPATQATRLDESLWSCWKTTAARRCRKPKVIEIATMPREDFLAAVAK
jgi:hypothetical protein